MTDEMRECHSSLSQRPAWLWQRVRFPGKLPTSILQFKKILRREQT
jgi:hypothetical protein